MIILALNPGATSTKFALFDDEIEVLKKSILHDEEEISLYSSIYEQHNFRENAIISELVKNKIDMSKICAVVGRGGMLKPISGGVYEVNEAMLSDLKKAKYGEHASNLGAIIANSIADKLHVKSYIVNPVSVDEMEDVARISGVSDLPRVSMSHALNSKAVAYIVSQKLGVSYQKQNYIIVHLGSGVSVTAHKKGKMVDVNNAQEEGPFSADRSGGLPTKSLVKLCYSGKYSEKEMLTKISGAGGMVDLLGTNNGKEIEDMVNENSEKAIMVVKAMAYQVSKEIGAMSTVLYGEVDNIIITGGFARFELLIREIIERVKFIAPIEIVPGEEELEALSNGVLRAIKGDETIQIYI